MLEITLISYEHDDNVRVCMVAQFFEPSCDVYVGSVFGNIVDKESADCAAIVPMENVGLVHELEDKLEVREINRATERKGR